MYDEYMAKTGKDRAQIEAWCRAETWFTASQAKEQGFIDSILERAKPSAQAPDWNLSAYANAPKAEREQAMATAEHRDRQAQRLRTLALLAP